MGLRYHAALSPVERVNSPHPTPTHTHYGYEPACAPEVPAESAVCKNREHMAVTHQDNKTLGHSAGKGQGHSPAWNLALSPDSLLTSCVTLMKSPPS